LLVLALQPRRPQAGVSGLQPEKAAQEVHRSIGISARYVHPPDAVLAAMSQLRGHKTGHSAENALRMRNGRSG